MRVLLVGSAEQGGISEHSAYLAEAVRAADPAIRLTLHTDLHPASLNGLAVHDVIHVNYHSALHSQWTPDWVQKYRDGGTKVVVTWHDSGVPNSDHCKSIHAVADAFVVHEQADDLPGALYWRQGVPDWSLKHVGAVERYVSPMVGTVGFPYGWKNYDLLVDAAFQAGWRTLIIAPGVDDVTSTAWRDRCQNRITVLNEFLPREEVVAELSRCHATAFLYNTHNTGTSGAIRQGIAARKPVIASKFPAGRQFRDLEFDPLGARAITWIEPNLENVVRALSEVRIAPIDAGMVALAERDSWANVGKKYAALYKELVAR